MFLVHTNVSAESTLNYQQYIDEANQSIDVGKYDYGIRVASAAILLDDSRFEGFVVIARVFIEQGEFTLAKEALQKAIKRAPSQNKAELIAMAKALSSAELDIKYHESIDKGYLALDNHQYFKAATFLASAWYIRPQETELAFNAINCWQLAENIKQPLLLINDVINRSSNTEILKKANIIQTQLNVMAENEYQSLLDQAKQFVLNKQYSSALALANQAIHLLPTASSAYLSAMHIYLVQNQLNNSLDIFKQGISQAGISLDILKQDNQFSQLLNHPDIAALLEPIVGKSGLQRLTLEVKSMKSAANNPKSEIISSTGLPFILIPAGNFSMGSESSQVGRNHDIEQIHQVKLTNDFYISTTEVTQQQWTKLMKENPSRTPGDLFPVHRVSLQMAKTYARKLSELDGKLYRLPTEAEWEYACKTGQEGHHSSFVNNTSLQQVENSKQNAIGLYGMYGNVYELTQDIFAPFSSSSTINPVGSVDGNMVVIKGGSWQSYSSALRCEHRSLLNKENFEIDTGFRLVREL